MKRVLVPTDFSENALNALNYARIIYKKYQVTFLLLHTYENLTAGTINVELDNEWLDVKTVKVTGDLQKLVRSIKKTNDNPNHFFNSISRSTSFLEGVKSTIRTQTVDCIFMGAKGPRGAFDIFMGSKAVTLINKLHGLPIILVPKIYSPETPSKIVFSTNFKRAFDKNELHLLTQLCKSLGCKLKILEVLSNKNLNDFQKANKEILKDLFKGLDFSFYKIDVKTTETAAIKEFVMASDSDLVSMVNHKLNFLYKLTEENVVRKVAFQSPVPLLILPELG